MRRKILIAIIFVLTVGLMFNEKVFAEIVNVRGIGGDCRVS